VPQVKARGQDETTFKFPLLLKM